MVKKNLFSLKKKMRKKKKKEFSNFEKVKMYFGSIQIKNKSKILINKIRKEQSDKINAIKKFFIIITGYGLIINYSIYFIFGIKFNLFTLFAWGIAYYFINDEFVEWFRRLIAKR